MPAEGAGGAGASASDSSSSSSGAQLEIEVLYKPTSTLRPLLGPVAADRDALITADDAAAGIAAYAAAAHLLSTDGERLRPDDAMLSVLWGRKEDPGSAVLLSDVNARVLKAMQQWYRVRRRATGDRPAVEALRRGAPRPVLVLAERRHGRNIISISRVEGFALDGQDLTGELARKFYTACSVSKLPGKTEQDTEVVMHGDDRMAAAVVQHLICGLGVPKEYLELTVKKK
jgi:translation initiation factor 1 (eIF-1/SUI1)